MHLKTKTLYAALPAFAALVCALSARPAHADGKVYHGSSCMEKSGKGEWNQRGYRATADNCTVYCPIVRDITSSDPESISWVAYEKRVSPGGQMKAWFVALDDNGYTIETDNDENGTYGRWYDNLSSLNSEVESGESYLLRFSNVDVDDEINSYTMEE